MLGTADPRTARPLPASGGADLRGLWALAGRVENRRRRSTSPRRRSSRWHGIFASTWQRPPTADELKGLIDDYVKEEIYVREAMRLGIDQDDTVIRRRLRMKMEFLNDAEAEATPPTDADLAAYLAAHPETFRRRHRSPSSRSTSMPEKRGAAAGRCRRTPGSLKKDAAFAASAGDPTLLPLPMPLTDRRASRSSSAMISQQRWPDWPGEWQGPIASGFGLHLVKVTAARPAACRRSPRSAPGRARVDERPAGAPWPARSWTSF